MNLQNPQILPTIEQWRTIESNRQLLVDRQEFVIPIVFRLISAASLVKYVPLVWVIVWLISIFGTQFWIRSVIQRYSALCSKDTQLHMMSPKMASLLRSYRRAWLVNCAAWCGLSLLSQIWLPLEMRIFCIVILNALMFIAITRTYVDRALMQQVTLILVFSQLLFVGARVILTGVDDFVVSYASLYMFYLVLMSYLLWAVGKRFSRMHIMRLDSEYAKLQLIETLNKNKEQLGLEQQALVASNKLVQQFYSGAAHDLRQPVYAMQLYTSMLAEDASLNKVLLPKITQSCISINDMFNTLFDYQQTHMNDTELAEKDIEISEIFKSLALQFQPIAAGKDLKIRFRPVAGSIRMVPLYLTRILSNLIANALRYTNAGGVLVAARKTRTCIAFEIWDTGIGIEEATVKHIFDEFYKVNNGNAANDGLGLGLAITKQLSLRVEQTDISVRSRPGRGSVFTFTVPLERYKEA